MSDNSDRPDDWLDELYQADNNDGPPAGLDAIIRAAARNAHGVRPWYKRTRTLASVATLALALGITSLWLGAPEDHATVNMAPAPMPAQETLPDSAVLVSDVQLFEEAAAPKDIPASPEATRARRVQGLEKSAAHESTQRSTEALEADPDFSIAAVSCTSLTLADPGESTPYTACQQDAGLRVDHPSCSDPFPLPFAKLEVDQETGGLIVTIEGRRSHLSCDPPDSWLLTPLADEN